MKIVLFFLLSSISLNVLAVTFEVRNPCRDEVLIQSSVPFDKSLNQSVGEFTIKQLQLHKVTYIGSAESLSSIFSTPHGDDSFDVVSNQEMYAYGWCYHFNNIEPNVMPNKIFLKNNSDHVVWFYAYSHYLNGEWITMCTPSFTRPKLPYCNP